MRSLKSKSLAVLLAAVLVLSLSCVTAFAAGVLKTNTYHFGTATLVPVSVGTERAIQGTNQLRIVFDRADVVKGSGEIKIYDDNHSSHTERIDVNSDQVVLVNDTDNNTTTVYINPVKSFVKKTTYGVKVDGTCFKVKDSVTHFKDISGDTWQLRIDEYGVFEENFTDLETIGGTDMLTVKLGGKAVKCEITPSDRTVITADSTTPDENGQITLTAVGRGTSDIVIKFYDKNGDVINETVWTVIVSKGVVPTPVAPAVTTPAATSSAASSEAAPAADASSSEAASSEAASSEAASSEAASSEAASSSSAAA